MDPPIPLKGVVLFIAFGTMVFIMVFCFVKRQITRFTLRTSSGPHVLIGSDAPKPLATEIERRLKWVKDILYEPPLLHPGTEERLSAQSGNSEQLHFVYRMKTVDAIKRFDAELRRCSPPVTRKPGSSLRSFLMEQRQTGPLEGTKLDLVEKFCNAYDHARHDPKEFTMADYQQFVDLMDIIIVHIKNKQNNANEAEPDVQLEGKSPKQGTSSKLLTHHLRYEVPAEHGTGATVGTANVGETSVPDVETTFGPSRAQSQRMANYALAGELSLKTDGAKSKQV